MTNPRVTSAKQSVERAIVDVADLVYFYPTEVEGTEVQAKHALRELKRAQAHLEALQGIEMESAGLVDSDPIDVISS